MTVDHIRGTVYATTIIMMVMMTITPARVKPDSLDLPALVRGSIESIAGGLAVYVVNAGSGRVRGCRGIGRHRIRIGGIGRVLHFLPVGLARDRIFRNAAEVVLLRERLQSLGVLLLVGVIVVDRFAHLEEVVVQGGLAGLLLRILHVRYGHGSQNADDRDHDDQFDEREAGLVLFAAFHGCLGVVSGQWSVASRYRAFFCPLAADHWPLLITIRCNAFCRRGRARLISSESRRH